MGVFSGKEKDYKRQVGLTDSNVRKTSDGSKVKKTVSGTVRVPDWTEPKKIKP